MNNTKPMPLTDPVCGMTVTESSGHTLQHEGRTYYFCSARCQDKFAANPVHYLAPAAPPAAPETQPDTPADTIYTCPMHPEVRQSHPGHCPKC
ncbi:MAG: YHS domain-containing protein, partial [Rhodoferax sp.]|nr:YHS domain-containing protein [Rhodoferax sp.]